MKTAIKPEGEGTKANPYQIKSLDDLLWIGEQASSEDEETYGQIYKMMNDIDASETQGWNDGAGFIPIGQDYHHAFEGTFDGNNKTITNLYINRISNSGKLCVGLFGCIGESAVIKNLTLKNVSISSTENAEGFARACVGGLTGYNYGTITKCTVSGNFTGICTSKSDKSYIYVGGLAGYNGGIITNCSIHGSAVVSCSSGDTYIGGLIGFHQGKISNCTALTGAYNTGPFVGELFGAKRGEIINCTSSNMLMSRFVSGDYISGKTITNATCANAVQ